MKRVFKYPIPSAHKGKFTVPLPEGFKFLRVSFQEIQLQMWCEVPDGAKTVTVDFQTYGTGQDIAPGAKYLTTYDMGPFVFHLYQLNNL